MANELTTYQRTSGMAIASLVLGIITVCAGWTFVVPLLAVIFGGVALGQMKKDPNLQGKGMAIAGLVLGLLSLLGWIIYISIAGFAFLGALSGL
jgi:hypothetical protein